MKVQLIVVQGKPEGKVIPLEMPRFRIGRGEDCQLRPNNEQVSRRHTEIVVEESRVIVRDLGSRNGTFLNHKQLGVQDGDHVLKNGDLIQVGPLTFAVSIQGAPASQASRTPKTSSLDEASGADIDAWLVGDPDKPAPERPSGVYTGDTQTFSAYQEAKAPKSSPEMEAKADDEADVIDQEEEQEEIFDQLDDETIGDDEDQEGISEKEFIDESNPFHTAKKKDEAAPTPTKPPPPEDSSRAAEDVLRRMMERRRAGR
ncbi:hypothetical protein BH23PLA1_BH23PLA1_01160 [soil metagenome]